MGSITTTALVATSVSVAGLSGAGITSGLAAIGGGSIASEGLGMAGGLIACSGVALLPVFAVGGITWGISSNVRNSKLRNESQRFQAHWTGQGYI